MARSQAARLLLLSTSDTDLLAAHRSGRWTVANPSRLDLADLPALLDGVALVVVRLLGGRQAWPEGLDAVVGSGIPTVVVSGENLADAALQSLSTVPAGVVNEALTYLVEGGVDNLRELAGFLSDTVLLDGEGFAPARTMPQHGVHEWTPADGSPLDDDTRPTVGIVYAADRRDRLLPGSRAERQHRVRRGPLRRRARRGRAPGARLLRLPARAST
jgi:cobaltochelatase CobN